MGVSALLAVCFDYRLYVKGGLGDKECLSPRFKPFHLYLDTWGKI